MLPYRVMCTPLTLLKKIEIILFFLSLLRSSLFFFLVFFLNLIRQSRCYQSANDHQHLLIPYYYLRYVPPSH